MSPEGRALRAFLEQARRRRASIDALRGASIGFLGAAGATTAMWMAGWAAYSIVSLAAVAGVALGAAAFIVSRDRRSLVATARAIERRAPDFRNLLVTAAELIERPNHVRLDIAALVSAHALGLASDLNLHGLFPLGRATTAVAASAAIAIASALIVAARPAPSIAGALGTPSRDAAIDHVEVIVVPPAYARRETTTLRDPAEVRALAGSRLRLRIETGAEAVTIDTIGGRQAVARQDAAAVAVEVVADRDGFLAIAPISADDPPAPPRLIGLAVDDDRPPVVRIVRPGRDLFLARSSDVIAIETVAEDDVGLRSLRLSYTTVSGSGENHEFRSGELPLEIAKRDDRHWSGSATLRLSLLKLAAGDSVVYRTTALDVRPGAAPVDSDSFMVQIASPDRAIAGGFTIEDEFNRYAISQQMVIMKTERLASRRRSLAAPSFAEEAQEIAAEQRRVRAEFVFMMGGEMEDLSELPDTLDETEEAERESDLAAGRLQNRGAVDVLLATRYMARAALLIAGADTARALTAERRALAALQRAFSKDRYLLRTLSTQQALDPSRRLGGKLTDLARESRPPVSPTESPRATALRRALAGVAALASQPANTRETVARATTLSQAVIAIDPAAPALREIARELADAASDIAANRRAAARERLDRAARALATAIRAELRDAPIAPAFAEGQLRGALTDALGSAPVITPKLKLRPTSIKDLRPTSTKDLRPTSAKDR